MMTAAQQIRWKQQTVNVHYPMFIAGHSLLRFSPCYKSGCGKLRGVTRRSRNAFEPQLAYNVRPLADVRDLNTALVNVVMSPAYWQAVVGRS